MSARDFILAQLSRAFPEMVGRVVLAMSPRIEPTPFDDMSLLSCRTTRFREERDTQMHEAAKNRDAEKFQELYNSGCFGYTANELKKGAINWADRHDYPEIAAMLWTSAPAKLKATVPLSHGARSYLTLDN